MRYLLLWCLCIWVLIVPTSAVAIRDIIGASIDSTVPPIPPCTTSGYSVDATLTFSLPANHALVFSRIDDRLRSSRIGYFISRNTINNALTVNIYDGTGAMSLLKTFELESSADLDYGAGRAGYVLDNDLFLVRQVNTSRLGCPAVNACMNITEITPTGGVNVGFTVSFPGIDVQVIDDALATEIGQLYVSFASATDRLMSILSIAGVGPPLGALSAGTFAFQPFKSDKIFIGYQDAVFTAKSFDAGSATPANTGTYAFSVAGNTIQAMTVAEPLNFVLGLSQSFGGIRGELAYKDFNLATTQSTVFYPLISDGGQFRGAAFYDEVNNKLHSFRQDVGSGAPSIIRSTVFPFVVEERFSCAGCVPGAFPAASFSQPAARLFVASSSVGTGTINRIKVCSAGGP